MKLIAFVEQFNMVIAMVIGLVYCYQVAYLAVGLLRRRWQDLHSPCPPPAG